MTAIDRRPGRRALNAAFRQAFRERFRPRPKLAMDEFAEQFVVLPASVSKRAGPLRLDVAPQLRPIMRAISNPLTQQITIIAPSQGAKTLFVIVVVLFYLHQEPSPIALVEPTIEMAEDISTSRFTPILEASPKLRHLIGKKRSRDTSNRIRSKQFPDAPLDFIGANSPTGLASRHKRVMVFDEVDRYPEEAGSEGDPFAIGFARTRSFQRSRKVIAVTSPTDEPERDADGRWSGSRGWREYLRGTREVWEEPCPHCGVFQELDFFRMQYETTGEGLDEKVVRESVRYPCIACAKEITAQHIPAMRVQGRFRATASVFDPTHRSFRWEGPSAAFALWDELCQEFLVKHADPVEFKTFMNTAIGRTWKDRRVENRATLLAQRAKPYDGREPDAERLFDLPSGVAVLTAGVDVQHDRLEVSLWGFGVGQQSWLISHQSMIGDPTQPAIWQSLDNWRQLKWAHESGAKVGIRAMAIDAGDGNMSGHVYEYCAPRFGERVFAIKGHNDPTAPLTPKKPTKVKPGRLYMLGVNGLTQRWYLRLDTTQPGPGYVNLNQHATDTWVRQLLGMGRVIDPRTRRRRWIARKNQRVEAIDCANYALGALLLSTRDEELVVELQRVHEEGRRAHLPEPVAAEEDSEQIPRREDDWVGEIRGPWV